MNYGKKWRWGMLAIALAATITISSPASSTLFDGPVDRLPVEERVALRQGRVVMTGEEGEYIGRILVKAPIATAWEVLTDYNNFQNFLPNVDKSEVIEKNGNSLVFEQVNVIRVFIFTQKPRVQVAVTQTYPQQIAFRVIEGDLDSLEGLWQIEPVSPYPGAPPDRVLIANQVTVDPGNISTRDLFFSIYKKSTSDTLAAIKKEIEKRTENN